MHQGLLIAIFAGLTTMFGWGLADFFAKKTIDAVGDVVSLVWAHLFGTIILVSVVVFQFLLFGKLITLPSDLATWGGLAFFGALQGTVYLLAYKGFGKGQVALLNPVFASYTGIVAIVSILVFGEIVSGHLLLSLVIIFIGILLLSLDPQALKLKKFKIGIPGLREIAAATVLAAVWTILWDKFVSGKDWLSYALIMYAFMSLTVYIVSRAQRVKLTVVKRPIWKFLILIGLCETIAYVALSLGFSSSSFTSVIVLIAGAFSLPTIVLARIFLKEKVTALQTVGSLVIVAGIILLSLQ